MRGVNCVYSASCTAAPARALHRLHRCPARSRHPGAALSRFTSPPSLLFPRSAAPAPYLREVCWVQIDVLSCDVPMHVLIFMNVLQAVQLGVKRRGERIRPRQPPSAPWLSLSWTLPSSPQRHGAAQKAPRLTASKCRVSRIVLTPNSFKVTYCSKDATQVYNRLERCYLETPAKPLAQL